MITGTSKHNDSPPSLPAYTAVGCREGEESAHDAGALRPRGSAHVELSHPHKVRSNHDTLYMYACSPQCVIIDGSLGQKKVSLLSLDLHLTCLFHPPPPPPLCSGCRDGAIHHHDVRKAEHCIGKSQHHQLEVCGLKWSPDGKLLASGSNDNLVCIWKLSDHQAPSKVLQGHQAAVKAVSWCPWKPNLLATGGGTNDGCVKFWNTATGQCLNSVDTGSQVSAIAWHREHREIITSHGLPKNQIAVWKYPTMTKVGELSGHSKRILHMQLSPKKTSVASASADETLRIWKCFEKSTSDESRSQSRLEDSITSLLHGSG